VPVNNYRKVIAVTLSKDLF